MNGSVEKYRTSAGELWRVRWDLPEGPSGQRRQRSKRGFGTKREASAFLRQVLAEQDRGRVSVRSGQSLRDACSAWLDLKRAQDKRATSLDNWTTALETHVYPRLGAVKVSDLRPEHVERLYLDLRRHGKRASKCRTAGVTCAEHGCRPENHPGLAPKSVQHVHGALRAVLARAVASGALAVNPADDPRAREALPKRTKDTRRVSEADYWTDAQARAFLASATEDPLRVLWSLALATGLRRGELAALLWRDVDLDGGSLRVRRSTTAVRGAAISTTGKTDAATRTVPLGPSTVAALRTHRREQRARALAAEPGTWTDTGHVFTEPDGQPVHPDRLTKRFSAASERAGLPRVGLHGCRHFAATQMLRRGVPVSTVARVLGHEDPAITWSTYSHAVPDDDSLAAAATESALYVVAESAV